MVRSVYFWLALLAINIVVLLVFGELPWFAWINVAGVAVAGFALGVQFQWHWSRRTWS